MTAAFVAILVAVALSTAWKLNNMTSRTYRPKHKANPFLHWRR